MNNREIRERLRTVWEAGEERELGGLVIKDYEVAHFLVKHAELMDVAPCMILDCEACNIDHTIWWEWCMSLSGPMRIRMQRIMRECGIPLPPAPQEDVSTNVVSASLN